MFGLCMRCWGIFAILLLVLDDILGYEYTYIYDFNLMMPVVSSKVCHALFLYLDLRVAVIIQGSGPSPVILIARFLIFYILSNFELPEIESELLGIQETLSFHASKDTSPATIAKIIPFHENTWRDNLRNKQPADLFFELRGRPTPPLPTPFQLTSCVMKFLRVAQYFPRFATGFP
jgi:hypothetical protein